jgi:uncharacterized Zn-finger protein
MSQSPQENFAPQDNTRRFIEITADDLPLHCPTPEMIAWNSHPRVFLDVAKTGEAMCPYCGTTFRLKGGPVKHGH